ncbi:sulfotransferase family 2 domain-containing protein [uncultured Aliiroseovarius sp.]|uniref:sulfotransferase family 2 domain-containing protein n=1 Tax=uncultured Aliiroseovarius sp. TaxID=1658783 RepID=UPI00262F6359|nr:sulfotransferase family 2 domain-containing protein [uncultured Aliiroseovarius sp.]
MNKKFDCFIILAEMRTGSNFLESNLDQFDGIQCYGEAFNPYFMVKPELEELFGVTVKQRDKNPVKLLEQMKAGTDGIPGFRFFHDHDMRIFEHVIDDPRCAKVVLTRNQVESYVSRRIAWATQQWALTNGKDAKKFRVRFDSSEFEKFFYEYKAFQLNIKGRLQKTGQTAFYIDYEDTQNLDVVNGLGKFLGAEHEITKFSGKYKKQNPETLAEKVRNIDELVETVRNIDLFDLGKVPNFEPARPPAVPTYVTAENAPLMYLPIKGGPVERVKGWMEGFGELSSEFNQKSLRQWKNRNKGHRTFTVLRHPVARLHAAFCTHFLQGGPETYWEIKNALRENYDVPLPEHLPDDSWDVAAHRAAFIAFANFVRRNLAGQTGIRVDASWATQSAVIKGFSDFQLPDRVLREDELEEGLLALAQDVGLAASMLPAPQDDIPFTLAQIYDDEVETAVKAAYQRDYMMFGYRPWGKS